MSQFARQKKRAMSLYHGFVLDGKDEVYRKDFHQGNIEGRILGEDCFGEKVLAKASQKVPHRITLEQVIQAVCKQYQIRQEDLSSGGRQRRISEPRSVAAFIVRETDHLSLVDLGRSLKKDLSGLSQAASRLDRKLGKDKELANKINKINALIT